MDDQWVYVRHTYSVSHGPACSAAHPGTIGTRSVTDCDVMPVPVLRAKLMGLSRLYGSLPQQTSTSAGSERWAFEGPLGSHRMSDMIISTLID